MPLRDEETKGREAIGYADLLRSCLFAPFCLYGQSAVSALLLGGSLSPSILAQVDAGGEPPQFDSGASLLWMLVQTVLVLVFICSLAYVVLRVLPRRAGGVPLSSMLQIVDRVPLDQRKSLYVVKVAGRWLLIGSSENGVHLISELDPDVARQEAELAVHDRPMWGGVSARAFADRLSDFMKKKR